MRAIRFCKTILMTACILCCAITANAQETSTHPTIYMVVWNGCEEACRGFSETVAVSGLKARLIIRDAQKDKTKIASFVREAKEIMPDLLVTWGTQISLQMLGTENDINALRYVTGIPAVFMVVSQPVESGLVSGLIAQGRPITGVSHLVSLPEQLQSARQYIPFKRIGVLYNAAETNAVSAVEQLKLYAPMMNYEVVDIKVPLDAKKAPDIAAIPRLVAEMANKKIDLLYLGTDAFLNTHRDALTEATMLHNIPVLSATEGAVRNGDALLAFVNRYYTVGQEAGQKAIQILKDNIPAYDIPITTPQRFLPVVNMRAAEKLSLYPPLQFLQNADLINTSK